MQNDVEPLETEIEGFAREESRLKDEIFEVSRDMNELKIEQRDAEMQRDALLEEVKKARKKQENYEFGRASRLREKIVAKDAVDNCEQVVDKVQKLLAENESKKKEALRKANEGMFQHTLLTSQPYFNNISTPTSL